MLPRPPSPSPHCSPPLLLPNSLMDGGALPFFLHSSRVETSIPKTAENNLRGSNRVMREVS